jgi:hypothetical protein
MAYMNIDHLKFNESGEGVLHQQHAVVTMVMN